MKKNKSSESENRYISYFQSVTTVGVITVAKNIEEAEKKAMVEFKRKEDVDCRIFNQTPFELSDTSLILQGIKGKWNSALFDVDTSKAPLEDFYIGK